MATELHLEERPTSLKQVVGQPEAVAQLVSLAKSDNGIPHCILFTGPSGCGKTTLARILRNRLRCGDSDFREVNAAENRGIEMVRGIQAQINHAPMDGECRVWLIDECHQLTPDAQGAFLKMLEEPPRHSYIMLATTNPEKLRTAIRTRATEIRVRELTVPEIKGLVTRICADRGITLEDTVADKLAEVAEGSARKALVLLQQVIGIGDTNIQLRTLQNADAKKAAIEIARAIMLGKGWGFVSKLVKAVDEEPESLRYMVLYYFNSVALGGGPNVQKAVDIMKCFECNYYDSKKAGFTISCFDACNL